MTDRPSTALVTCAGLPELDPDDRLLLAPLEQAGVAVTVAVWDDPAVDWAAFDLVVLRNPWDYAPRRDEFVAWARSVPRLANSADVVAWNTDKRYLRELAAGHADGARSGKQGVPTVPTTWVAPGEAWSAPEGGEWVVKPAISAGSKDTGRYNCADAATRDLAAAHVARLAGDGRLVMVQPYLGAVDSYGETGLLYLGGRFSHAIRKGPILRGPVRDEQGLYVEEHITAREPSPAERELAEATLDALPFGREDLLYARVDLLRDGDGRPVVIEVELTEPSLFFATAPGAAQRFAELVARRAATVSP